MRPELRSLDFDPDPTTFSSEPSEFSFLPRVIVGPSDGPGEESFDGSLCARQSGLPRLAEESVESTIHAIT